MPAALATAFVTQTAALLKAFETRRFDQHTFAVLLLDGKYLAGVQMIVAMGITTEGEKVVLGFAESRTENSAQVQSLLQDLLRRGFTHTDKLLVQVDGSRGLRKGISAVFGDAVVFQRCQWHKRTNVTRHIKSEPAATQMKRRLQAAWELPTYKEARAALVSLHGNAAAIVSEGRAQSGGGFGGYADASPVGGAEPGCQRQSEDDEHHREPQQHYSEPITEREALGIIGDASARLIHS